MDRFAKLPFSEKFKDIPGVLDAGKMVLFDIFVHVPFFTFLHIILLKSLLLGQATTLSTG